jgi:hypothetical protein
MLRLTIPATEQWDEKNNQFITTKEQTLLLEHSLISLSKWESKWCKPFLTKEEKTFEETIDYVRCMCIHDVDPKVLRYLTNENVSQINNYIEAPMTATTFSKDINNKSSREQVTAELVYYWMIALNIPFECENWHLNRLLTLIKVCNIKNTPPKKMSKSEISRRNAALNAARRKQYNTKG